MAKTTELMNDQNTVAIYSRTLLKSTMSNCLFTNSLPVGIDGLMILLALLFVILCLLA